MLVRLMSIHVAQPATLSHTGRAAVQCDIASITPDSDLTREDCAIEVRERRAQIVHVVDALRQHQLNDLVLKGGGAQLLERLGEVLLPRCGGGTIWYNCKYVRWWWWRWWRR